MCRVLNLIKERTKILRLRLLQQEEEKVLQRLRQLNKKQKRFIKRQLKKRFVQKQLKVVLK